MWLEWVKTKDRTPDNDDLVLVYGGIARFYGDHWITETGCDAGRPIQWEVTHWAPLPFPNVLDSEPTIAEIVKDLLSKINQLDNGFISLEEASK